MNGIVVSDASPLHYLILTDTADLLPRLFSQILVPPAVVAELSVEETPLKVRHWLENVKDSLQMAFLLFSKKSCLCLALRASGFDPNLTHIVAN